MSLLNRSGISGFSSIVIVLWSAIVFSGSDKSRLDVLAFVLFSVVAAGVPVFFSVLEGWLQANNVVMDKTIIMCRVIFFIVKN